MKPVSKQLRSFGPSVKLYREDVEHILVIFKEHCEKVKISDDDYEYESLDDLEKQIGKFPKILTISGSNPYVGLILQKDFNRLYLYGSQQFYGEKKSEPVFLMIREFLSTRKSKFSNIFNNITLIFYSMLIIALSVLSTLLISSYWMLTSFLILSLTVSVVLIILTFYVKQGGFSSINLHRKHEPSTFFARNKDTLIVSIVVGIIVAVITWAITYFTTN